MRVCLPPQIRIRKLHPDWAIQKTTYISINFITTNYNVNNVLLLRNVVSFCAWGCAASRRVRHIDAQFVAPCAVPHVFVQSAAPKLATHSRGPRRHGFALTLGTFLHATATIDTCSVTIGSALEWPPNKEWVCHVYVHRDVVGSSYHWSV